MDNDATSEQKPDLDPFAEILERHVGMRRRASGSPVAVAIGVVGGITQSSFAGRLRRRMATRFGDEEFR